MPGGNQVSKGVFFLHMSEKVRPSGILYLTGKVATVERLQEVLPRVPVASFNVERLVPESASDDPRKVTRETIQSFFRYGGEDLLAELELVPGLFVATDTVSFFVRGDLTPIIQGERVDVCGQHMTKPERRFRTLTTRVVDELEADARDKYSGEFSLVWATDWGVAVSDSVETHRGVRVMAYCPNGLRHEILEKRLQEDRDNFLNYPTIIDMVKAVGEQEDVQLFVSYSMDGDEAWQPATTVAELEKLIVIREMPHGFLHGMLAEIIGTVRETQGV